MTGLLEQRAHYANSPWTWKCSGLRMWNIKVVCGRMIGLLEVLTICQPPHSGFITLACERNSCVQCNDWVVETSRTLCRSPWANGSALPCKCGTNCVQCRLYCLNKVFGLHLPRLNRSHGHVVRWWHFWPSFRVQLIWELVRKENVSKTRMDEGKGIMKQTSTSPFLLCHKQLSSP